MRIAMALAGGLLGCLTLVAGAAAREVDEVPCDETVFVDARTFSCEEDTDPLLDLDAGELAGCAISRLRVRVRGGRVRMRIVTERCAELGRPRLHARFEGPARCPGLSGVVLIDGDRYPVALLGLDRAEDLCFAGEADPPDDEPIDPGDDPDGGSDEGSEGDE
ncbi:MAG: hypothetical protein KIT14_05865 [bacterium]|nr:hypothetical protein [bacterium]